MGKHTDSAMEDALDGDAGASEADENALGEQTNRVGVPVGVQKHQRQTRALFFRRIQLI